MPSFRLPADGFPSLTTDDPAAACDMSNLEILTSNHQSTPTLIL